MTPSLEEKFDWLALSMISGLGAAVFRNLIDVFGSPAAVFEADSYDLTRVKGVRKEIAEKIIEKSFIADPEKELKRVAACQARLLTYRDPSFPPLLRTIPYSPVILYAKGKEIPADQSFIAVVGSRIPSHYGLRAAENFGFGLASRGVGVISGMARGIDSAAHRGCLRAKGFTIAVMGTGIDVVYPVSNRKLMNQILDHGAVITEFPMGSPPEPKNFPVRNRIISGVSRGVVVVEATLKSGSLITASLALDQGRDVFAVPGSIESFKSRGTHHLIKQGAKLVENADDVLEEFGFDRGGFSGADDRNKREEKPPDLNPAEARVYDLLGKYPVHIDQIVREAGMAPGEVLSILLRLELKGIVRQLPGKMFVR